MPIFHYRAVTRDGALLQGRLEAIDRTGATARLQAQGNVLLALTAVAPGRLRALLTRDLGGRRNLTPRAVVELVGRLSIMLAAGVSTEGTLDLLAGSEGSSETHRTSHAHRFMFGCIMAGRAIALVIEGGLGPAALPHRKTPGIGQANSSLTGSNMC